MTKAAVNQWMLPVLVVTWGLLGLVGAAAAAIAVSVDDAWCEHDQGDSDFGDASWSWWPIGIQCSWSEPPNLVTDHEEPSWGPTAFVAVYLAMGIALVWAAKGRQRGRVRSPAAQGRGQPSRKPWGMAAADSTGSATGRCAFCATPLIEGSCPSCDRPPRAMWSTTAAGVIAVAGVVLLGLAVLILVVLSAIGGGS